jgi:hypothetical protein
MSTFVSRALNMKKSLSTLSQYFSLDTLIIHSLDMCLYQASVLIEADGEECWICDNNGKLLKTHSIIEMQKHCSVLKVKQQRLRQRSAYDEMVGGPTKCDNTLEVPLSDQKLY